MLTFYLLWLNWLNMVAIISILFAFGCRVISFSSLNSGSAPYLNKGWSLWTTFCYGFGSISFMKLAPPSWNEILTSGLRLICSFWRNIEILWVLLNSTCNFCFVYSFYIRSRSFMYSLSWRIFISCSYFWYGSMNTSLNASDAYVDGA